MRKSKIKKLYLIGSGIVASIVIGFILFLYSSGNPQSSEASSESTVPWLFVVLVFTSIATIAIIVFRKHRQTNRASSETRAEETSNKNNTPWIDKATGPAKLIGLWAGVIIFIHIILQMMWPDVWWAWFDQHGLFAGFNLCFLAAVFFMRQQFQGTKYVSVLFLVLAMLSLTSAITESNSNESSETIPITEQEWKYTWTISEGVSRDGYQTKTHRVTINELSGSIMDFTLHYKNNGQKQESNFRWDKSTRNRGTWHQTDPWSEGTFVLNKVSDDLYTGHSYGKGPKGEAMMHIELRRVK